MTATNLSGYTLGMSSAFHMVQERYTKASSRAARLRAQLAAAEAEMNEAATALKVLSDIGLGETAAAEAGHAAGTLADQVWAVLGHNEAEAKAPREIAEKLRLSNDSIRTTVHRLVTKGRAVGRNGRYWRAEAKDPVPEPLDDAEEEIPF